MKTTTYADLLSRREAITSDLVAHPERRGTAWYDDRVREVEGLRDRMARVQDDDTVRSAHADESGTVDRKIGWTVTELVERVRAVCDGPTDVELLDADGETVGRDRDTDTADNIRPAAYRDDTSEDRNERYLVIRGDEVLGCGRTERDAWTDAGLTDTAERDRIELATARRAILAGLASAREWGAPLGHRQTA